MWSLNAVIIRLTPRWMWKGAWQLANQGKIRNPGSWDFLFSFEPKSAVWKDQRSDSTFSCGIRLGEYSTSFSIIVDVAKDLTTISLKGHSCWEKTGNVPLYIAILDNSLKKFMKSGYDVVQPYLIVEKDWPAVPSVDPLAGHYHLIWSGCKTPQNWYGPSSMRNGKHQWWLIKPMQEKFKFY